MKSKIEPSAFGDWALITGASSGIGEGFARRLAAEGFNLVLVARRKELLFELGGKLSSRYDIQCQAIQADLTRKEGIDSVIESTGNLEVGLLISNAGTGNVARFFDRAPEDLTERIHLNATSHLLLTHHFGQKMALRKKGGILLTGAMGAVEGVPYMATEAATKGFIQALGKSLHAEFKEFGIHITVLVTTPTETPIFYKLGFSLQNTPVKPLSVEQCVAEALNALAKNKMLVYPGLKFRVMRALIPEPLSRKMSARILKRNNNIL
ncbi:SDR family NAD(P)-dependent oxidoreductase [Puia dinghuensis]|uniref:Short-chain dehydrogenase n=1 Tax=Puia dinghuensis TaxID=1792502 RepID=A0A8J2XSM1_9BACT|nr:SDR family NAD(P)-dependent oxidoreductase [Puia dinghuensis]GGA96205.1 short-chain dehydrogenase [Puia dinghuensis]